VAVPASAQTPTGLEAGVHFGTGPGDLLPAGSRILVALSGGIDSVVLLHLLHFQCHDSGFVLSAAHFDHRMRTGSDRDASWVRGLCRAWAIPLVQGVAASELSSERAARDARYAFLEEAADRTGSDLIATAHHADDQVETVLFRMLRGTGLRGLAGIPERRGRIVRPLLRGDRQSIRNYARRSGLVALDDPTNADRRFARNRIRHDILPALDRHMPGARAALLRLAAEAAAQEAAWNPLIDAWLDRVRIERSGDAILLARDGLLGYHRHVCGRIVRRAFERLGRLPGHSGTLAALAFINNGVSGHSITLAGGYRIEREFDRIVFRPPSRSDEAGDEPLEIRQPGEGRGRVRLAGRIVDVTWRTATGPTENDIALDPAILRFPLEVRGWRPGDRIRAAAGTRKLKKVFAEKRIPRSDRNRLCVLAGSDGRVLWAEGVGRAADAEPPVGAPAFLFRWADGNDG
jgi:tRNA(Ile)-lysidine synthase